MTETNAEAKHKLPMRSVFTIVLALVAALAAPCGAEAYQSVNKYVSGGHGYLNASYLVIHETANPGASAYNHTLLWSRDDTYAVHHVMELDGSTVYNTVAENRLCWHVGNGNGYTIGIELAHATNASDFAKQWSEAVKWAGDELRAHGWDTSRLLSHYEAAQRWGGSDHTDPIGYFRAYGKTWVDFKQAVAAYLGSDYVAPIAPTDGNGGTVASSTTTAKTDTSFGGTYRCTVSSLNVRSTPSLYGAVVASYGYGQTVNLDNWYCISNGYVWGRYTSYSGCIRYVAVGKPTGGYDPDDYLVRAGAATTSQASTGSVGRSGGCYRVVVGTLNVRSGAGTGYGVVASYHSGQTANLDGTFVTAGGYVWGRYTSYSGHTRWIAVGTTSGAVYAQRA
nr:MAG TPA: Endolysin [Caudoviricetes sp.]